MVLLVIMIFELYVLTADEYRGNGEYKHHEYIIFPNGYYIKFRGGMNIYQHMGHVKEYGGNIQCFVDNIAQKYKDQWSYFFEYSSDSSNILTQNVINYLNEGVTSENEKSIWIQLKDTYGL